MKSPKAFNLLKIRKYYSHKIGNKLQIIGLFAILLFLLVPQQAQAQAAYATGGSGSYKPNILWLTWGGGVNGTDNAKITAGTTSNNIALGGGNTLTLTRTVSNIVLVPNGAAISGPFAYRPGDWTGDGLDNMYNIGGVGSLNNLINGIRFQQENGTINLTLSAQINGVTVDLPGVVVADAEQTANTESVVATGDGNWSVLDFGSSCGSAYSAIITNPSGTNKKVQFGPISPAQTCSGVGSYGPNAVGYLNFNSTAYSGANRQVTVTVGSNGPATEAVAVGLILPFDYGDAPAATYGTANNYLPQTFSPTLASGTTNLQGYALATPIAQTLTIGSSVDSDSIPSVGNATATLDDTTGIDDETGVTVFPALKTDSTTYSVTVSTANATGANATLIGWLDFNRNGVFESTEAATATIANGATSADLNWSISGGNMTTPSAGATYARFRIASTNLTTSAPSGTLLNGETEDYAVTIVGPDLTIAKSHVGSFVRGSTGIYNLTVSDANANTSGTITVTDTLPAGLSVLTGAVTLSGANAGNWTCNATTTTSITCTSSTVIAAGGNSTFSFIVDVATTAGTPITNNATVSGGNELAANNGNNSASDPTTTVAGVDLKLSKSHAGSFTVGTTGTYSFSVFNDGGANSSGTITVTDTLPLGLTVNGGAVGGITEGGTNAANWTCNSNAATPQVITCTSSTVINASATSVFNFPVDVGLGTAVGTNSITNNASVSGGNDGNTNNNTASDPTTVLSPDLTIAKSHTGSFTIGSTGTYSFSVGNSGTASTSGTITVSDTLPLGLTVNGGAAGAVTIGGTNSANWTCNSNATSPQTITCTSSTVIAISGTSDFNFDVNVGARTAVGTNSITNTVTVSGGGETNVTNDSSSDSATVSIPFTSCGTLLGVNTGVSPTNGIFMVNPTTGVATAIGVKPVSSSASAVQPSTGNLYYFNGGSPSPVKTYRWNRTTGVSTLLPTTASVGTNPIRAAFTSTGRLFGADVNNLFYEINPTTGALISSGTVTLVSGGALPASSGDMAFDGNGTLFYTVGNLLYSVDITTLKATLVSTNSVGLVFPGIAFDGTGNLYGGTDAFLSIVHSIDLNTGITTPIGSAGVNLTDLGSCSFPTPTLASTKTVAKVAGSGGATISPGDTLEYTITTTNSGNAPATSSTLTDAIPTGTTYVASSTKLNGGAVSDVSGVMPYVTANEIHGVGMNSGVIGSNTGVNNVATVVFQVTVNSSSPPSTVSNQGTINFANGTAILTDDPSVGGATDPTVSTISSPDLTIAKSHTGNFTRGASGTYILTVSNIGVSITSGTITVVDTLPSGLSVADGALTLGGTNSADWGCNSTSNVITCTSSTAIATSGTSAFSFDIDVSISAAATVTNTVAVSGGNEATVNNGNNSATDPTNTISSPPNVQLAKSCPFPADCTTAPQLPGTDVTYQIAFTNTGGVGAINMAIVDRIPDNTDYKLSSASSSLGTTGLTMVIEYSNDYDPLNPSAATWSYTPISGGGGATAGYDRLVKAIRWRVTAGTLSNVSPNNTGNVSFVTKIR